MAFHQFNNSFNHLLLDGNFVTGFIVAPHYLFIAISVFSIFMVCLVIYMLIFMLAKNNLRKKHDKRKNTAYLLIQRAIFAEDDESLPDASFYHGLKLLDNVHFRNILTNEIISAKKNISGISSVQIKQLYKNLNLNKYSLKKLYDYNWYIKAKGIQELAIMELHEYIDEIYPFADHKNELVRMEAQTAIVQLNGFNGLKFLNTITYPIADWQQIKLLKELSNLPVANFNGIDNWLKSANYTVIVFALRIAKNYNLFNLHDDIIACLDHENSKVRLLAIYTLNELYTGETAWQLKNRYNDEILTHQMAIIKVLQNIGTEDELPFLYKHLNCENYELKLLVLRTIATLSKNDFQILEKYTGKNDYPLADMILQIKGELAA